MLFFALQDDPIEEASPGPSARRQRPEEETGNRPFKRLKKGMKKLYSLDAVPEQAAAGKLLSTSTNCARF